MKQSIMVGRSEILHQLIEILIQGRNREGHMVFIEGVAGMGKTMLLEGLQQEVTYRPELKESTFVKGVCHERTGTHSAYEPFVEILKMLTQPETVHRDLAAHVLNILKETAPNWLQMISKMGLDSRMETIIAPGQQFLEEHNNMQTYQLRPQAPEYVNMLTRVSSQQNSLVLIIEDGHWIDDASCQLLQRLGSKISTMPLVVLLTYRPDYLETQHPLKEVRRELLIQGQAQRLALSELTEEHIRDYILKRFGTSLHPRLAAWLENQCKGNPLFVTQYLSLLEQNNVIQRENNQNYHLNGHIRNSLGKWELSGVLANIAIPDRLEAVLEQRLESLLEEDRELLRLGSVQGDFFMSLLLVELLNKKEHDVLSRLRQVIERHRIISLYVGDEWFKGNSEFYAFEHHLMQQAFYNQLSPHERMQHHRNVAWFLERILEEHTNPPRRLLLEVADDYSQGNEPLLAAQYYYRAAQSSFLDGAFTDTAELCKLARSQLKCVGSQERMLAEVLQLLCVVSENWWRGSPILQGELPLLTLAQEAEEAARRTGDQTLIAQALYFKGKGLLVIEGLQSCLQTLQKALKAARQGNDRFCEVAVMEELGHHLVSENLDKGLNMLIKAYNLYQRALTTMQDVPTKAHKRLLHRIQGHIGVAKFDSGYYDDAEEWLKKSIDELKKLSMYNDLPRMLSFRGQLYMAMGRFDEAKQTFNEAIDIYKNDEEANAWRGYNLALLAKLYIEWERFDDAAEPMDSGWKETQETQSIDLVPLVRNYYAELMMQPKYRGRDFVKAEQLLNDTLTETRASGFHRSEIAALTLRSQLALLQGQSEKVIADSTQAINYLHRLGTMPALRTEEVLFNHYLALRAINREVEAVNYLKQAYKIIQEKVRTITNLEYRNMFLERIPLNREIKKAYAAI